MELFYSSLTQLVEQDQEQRVAKEKYLALQRDNPNNSAAVKDTTNERLRNLNSLETLKTVRSLLKARKILIFQLPNKIEAKLQNNPQLLCISLNKNRLYCTPARSSENAAKEPPRGLGKTYD